MSDSRQIAEQLLEGKIGIEDLNLRTPKDAPSDDYSHSHLESIFGKGNVDYHPEKACWKIYYEGEVWCLEKGQYHRFLANIGGFVPPMKTQENRILRYMERWDNMWNDPHIRSTPSHKTTPIIVLGRIFQAHAVLFYEHLDAYEIDVRYRKFYLSYSDWASVASEPDLTDSEMYYRLAALLRDSPK